jgi:hypothetical protein
MFMFKRTLVKWAIAALLAVPAVSLFSAPASAQTTTRTLSSRLHHKHTLSSYLHRHHRLHSRRHHHVTLSTRHHRHSVSSLRSSSVHPTVKITKMPPTIDGMNT